MDFDAQKTSDAIGEGERFLQLMHGIDWMVQLSKVALASEQLVKERKDQAAAIDMQAESTKADFKEKYGKLTVELNAQIDALQSQLGALESNVKAKAEELAALEASAVHAKAQYEDEAARMKAGADAILAALNAEADAKAKERDALQAAIDDMHAKIAGLK